MSPTNGFNREIWNTGKILLPFGKASRYATELIFFVILNGLKYLLLNFNDCRNSTEIWR